MSFFSLRFLASILFVLNFSSGVNASGLLDDISDDETFQLRRQGFIVAQSELLQSQLDIVPTEETIGNPLIKILKNSKKAEMNVFFRVNTLKFDPPYDFLNREGPRLNILQKEDGNKLLDEAKKTIFSLKNKKSKYALFYFQILFWNALTEQINNPDLVDYPWHKAALDTIFCTEEQS